MTQLTGRPATPKKKWYAVWRGRETGVFDSWVKVKTLVIGVASGYASRPTYEEAVALYEEMATSRGGTKAAVESQLPTSGVIAFTDGSFRHGRYSWAYVVIKDGSVIHTDKGAGADQSAQAMRNVAGEIEAVINAVRWADAQGLRDLTIIHDYIGLSEWARGLWKAKHPAVKRYVAFISQYPWVRFIHVKGHTGVTYNEMVDRLAAEALEGR